MRTCWPDFTFIIVRFSLTLSVILDQGALNLSQSYHFILLKKLHSFKCTMPIHHLQTDKFRWRTLDKNRK